MPDDRPLRIYKGMFLTSTLAPPGFRPPPPPPRVDPAEAARASPPDLGVAMRQLTKAMAEQEALARRTLDVIRRLKARGR